MKFESKNQMVQALLNGRCFIAKVREGEIIYYDESFANPFRHGVDGMVGMWHLYDEDIWEELEPQYTSIIGGAFDLCQQTVVEEAKPRHIHQDLIDSYQEGQAWQYRHSSNANWRDLSNHLIYWQPDWVEDTQYRLHPYNELIQAHHKGATIQAYICGDWVEEPNPDWSEDTQYRVKPTTETVYEWVLKSKLNNKWMIDDSLMSEADAKVHFVEYEYRKTGRSWEVEV